MEPTADAARALDFSDRVAVITGGTKGVGRAIAARFLAQGAEVVVLARNAPDRPVDHGARAASFVGCDVREPEQVHETFAAVAERHGRIDVLVNNAGGGPPADSSTASARFNERVVALNLLAPLSCAQAVRPVMAGQPSGGVIVNIASVSGTRANPHGVAYGAAKAGLLNLTRTLAVEWGPAIRVVAVTAGLVLTDEARAFYGDDEGVRAIGATIALGRLAEPADIADVCLFLASPLARYVSGTAIEVHGGGERPAYLAAATGEVR